LFLSLVIHASALVSEVFCSLVRSSEIINSSTGIDGMLFPDGPEETISDIKKVGQTIDEYLKEAGSKDYSAESRVYSEDTDLQGMSSLSGKIASPEIDHSGIQSLGQSFEDTAAQVAEATLDMSSSIGDFVTEFATGLGELMSGASTFQDFGNVILKAVANFMGSLGKQLIAIGMAGIAAKALAKNPYLALAAGVALVALSAAATSALSSNPMSGGSSSSLSSGSYSGMSNGSNKLEIVGVIKGADIYWSQKQYDKQINNTTSRSR